MRLTDESIKKRKHPATGQQFDWDDLVAGFGIRYTPTKAAYVVTWREPNGKRPRETLRAARVGAIKVAEARDLARKRLSEVTGNAQHGGSVALSLAIRAWYERQSELPETWRPRYRRKVDSIISAYVEGEERARITLSPAARAAIVNLGSKPVAAVSRTDIMRVADAIKPGSAEQFMAILSSFFNSAYEREVVTGNPARNRLRVTGGRRLRHRILSDAEFIKLWQTIENEGDPAAGAFMLLAFTGARRNEVAQMRWLELDLNAATWTIPPARRKTGKKDPEPFVINLHPIAVDILRRQLELDGSPYVFWGRRDKRSFDFHHSLMERLRAAAGVKDWRLHDLRRYMRSGLSRLGVQQVVAEMCLGHVAKSGLVAVYDRHAYVDEKRNAWWKWGDYLTQLVERAS